MMLMLALMLLCCCCCCCCLVSVLGTIAGILYAMFETPDVGVESCTWRDLQITTSETTFVTDTLISINNSNAWPFTATVENITANIWSLDKRASAAIGEELYVGKAYPAGKVEVKTDAVSNFTIRSEVVVKNEPATAKLFARIGRDCGATVQEKKTKIKVTLTDMVASVAGIDFDLSSKKITIELEIPCDSGSPPSAPSYPSAGQVPTQRPSSGFLGPTAGPTTARPSAAAASGASTSQAAQSNGILP
mmetsp:Transcript_95416/g.298228  ORF Transcript_95416/g.298228 Transcript_95416/m.298228 type:complete len:248 (-) Transcript_95416:255-998(-)